MATRTPPRNNVVNNKKHTDTRSNNNTHNKEQEDTATTTARAQRHNSQLPSHFEGSSTNHYAAHSSAMLRYARLCKIRHKQRRAKECAKRELEKAIEKLKGSTSGSISSSPVCLDSPERTHADNRHMKGSEGREGSEHANCRVVSG